MQKVYTKIESIVGNVVTVRAQGVRNADLALVGDSYASVIKLDKDKVSLQVFAGAQGVSTTDPVRFLGRPCWDVSSTVRVSRETTVLPLQKT